MSIKIDFKNKIYALPRDVITIQQIQSYIKKRYPDNFKFGISLAMITTNSINFVKSDQELERLKSSYNLLKLKAMEDEEEIPQAKSLINEQKKIIQKNIEESKNNNQKQLKLSKIYDHEESKNQISTEYSKMNPSKIHENLIDHNDAKSIIKQYKCYKCNGTGTILTQNQISKICPICLGNKKIDENNSLIELIDDLLTGKLNGLIQILKKQKDLNQINQKKKQKIQKNYTFSFVEQPVPRIRTYCKSKYYWDFHIQNDCESDWPTPTILCRLHKNKIEPILSIESLKRNQTIQISLSFIAQEENIIQLHEFKFGYFHNNNKNKLIFFQPKLNYYLDTQTDLFKSNVISKEKILKSKVQKVCKSLKRLNECKIIFEKLKQLKIEAQISIDFLTDIITDIF